MVRKPNAGHRANRKPKNKRFLIYSGGIVTEMEYFKYVRQHLFGKYVRSLRIKSGERSDPVRMEADGFDPKTLVDETAKLLQEDKRDAKRESYDAFAVVWVITDVDDFGDKLREAVNEGHRRGIEVIISNPCFDVWLIDHVRSCPRSYTQTAECEKLAKQLGLIDMSRNPNNPKHINFDRIVGKYLNAAKNAQQHMDDDRQQRTRISNPGGEYAPWTDVPHVADTLIDEYRRLIDDGEERTL